MYAFGNDPQKIEGYKKFWAREKVKRPLVGFSFKSWFPLDEFKASASWKKDAPLTPEMIHPEDFLEDQEHLLREGEEMGDDILRGASPSQAVFWGEGILGSSMRVLPGNVVAEEQNLSWEEAERVRWDSQSLWFQKYIDFIDTLVKHSRGRYPVSHGTLTGPFDYLVNLRGHEQAVIDLMLEPDRAYPLLQKMGDFFIWITREAWKRIPLFYGGYFDAQYSLWAPGSIIRMQEDGVAVLSPDLYQQYLKPVDQEVASCFESSFIHLHATSMFVLDKMLEIPAIRCYEINNDVGGPPLDWLIPYFQQVQQANKPLLIRGSFTPEELSKLMDSLEPQGLYLYIMVTQMKEVEALRKVLNM
ncbi:MAG: hypothetical protein SNJ78_04650 [Spirochaetales bacterium]